MPRIWLPLLSVSLGFASACQLPPSIEGTSLRCEPGPCPEGLRCYDGICVSNLPPRLGSFGDTKVVTVGQPFAFRATATDDEADDIVFRWRQESGPPLDFNATGALIEGSPEQVGLYAFTVEADDGYLQGQAPPSTQLRIIAQDEVSSGTATFYVARGSAFPDPVCGAFDAPCASVAAALAVAASQGVVATILVAANTGHLEYDECLDLPAGASVRGGYDPEDWQHYPARRIFTRFRCCPGDSPGACTCADDSCGHRMAGATLEDVTLSMAPGTTFTTDGLTLATVRLQGPTDTVRGIDVEVPDCSGGCNAVAVQSTGAGIAMEGIQIYPGLVAQFDNGVGLLVAGGSAVLGTGSSETSARASKISLDARGAGDAVGILVVGAHLDMRQAELKVSNATTSTGLISRGAAVVIRDSMLNVAASASRQTTGLELTSCEFPSRCSCAPLTACPATTLSLAHEDALLSGNEISVQDETLLTNGASCVGRGIVAHIRDATITGNVIDVFGGFPNAAALSLNSDPLRDPEPDSEGMHALLITDNRLTVGPSIAMPACDVLGQGQDAGLPLGEYFGFGTTYSVGIEDVRSVNTTVRGNLIQVAQGPASTAGIVIAEADGSAYIANTIEVTAEPVRPDLAGVGAILLHAHTPSSLSSNHITVGHNYSQAWGIRIAELGGAMWNIENNMVAVRGSRPTGLSEMDLRRLFNCAQSLPSPWPRIINNTFSVGDHASTLVNVIRAQTCEGEAVGANNLFDVPDGAGRVQVINADGSGASQRENFHILQDNLVQVGTREPPRIRPFALPAGPWLAVMAHSGEVVDLPFGGATSEFQTYIFPQRVTVTDHDRGNIRHLAAGPGFLANLGNLAEAPHQVLLTDRGLPTEALLSPTSLTSSIYRGWYNIDVHGVLLIAEHLGENRLWSMYGGTGDDPLDEYNDVQPVILIDSNDQPFALPADARVARPPLRGALCDGSTPNFLSTGHQLYYACFDALPTEPVTVHEVPLPDTVQSIEQLFIHTGDGFATHVFFISNGRLYVARYEAGSDTWVGEQPGTGCDGATICDASTVTSLQGGWLSLLLGCEDGQVEAYNLVSPSTLSCRESFSSGFAPGQLQTAIIRPDYTTDNEVVVVGPTPTGTEARLFVDTIFSAAISIESIHGYGDDPDLASCVPCQDGGLSMVAAGSCALERDPLSSAYLHLIGDGGMCADTGSTTIADVDGDIVVPITDFDGDVRDASPDIGADEVP